MEELLPLIIGILWLVYTFYTKGKKKQQQGHPGTAPKTAEKPSFIEQLLAAEGFNVDQPRREEREIVIPYESYQGPERRAVPSQKGKVSPFLDGELSSFEEEGQLQIIEPLRGAIPDGGEMDLSPWEPDTKMEEFDLRKAVVLSAILEAPYIDYK